jgi:hypothetical protein
MPTTSVKSRDSASSNSAGPDPYFLCLSDLFFVAAHERASLGAITPGVPSRGMMNDGRPHVTAILIDEELGQNGAKNLISGLSH